MTGRVVDCGGAARRCGLWIVDCELWAVDTVSTTQSQSHVFFKLSTNEQQRLLLSQPTTHNPQPTTARSAPTTRFRRSAFTLVELIIVMALLATLMALSVPSLARSLRQRNLEGEAARLLALTEYGRDEAVSLGIPMIVWIDTDSRRFGVDAKTGYAADGLRRKEYTLNPDVNFGAITNAVAGQGGRGINAVEFEPDGTMDSSSVDSIPLADRFKSGVSLVQTTDHYGYEIVKETH